MQRALQPFRLLTSGCILPSGDSVGVFSGLTRCRREAKRQRSFIFSRYRKQPPSASLAASTLPLRLTSPDVKYSPPVVSRGRSWGQNAARGMQNLSAARVSAAPLSSELRAGLQRLGIRKLAEVQRLCVLRALQGTSITVAASPGAGKTLAYLLPVLQRFVSEGGVHEADTPDMSTQYPFALLLVPSRELARQVMTIATALLPQAPILLLDPTAPLRQQQQMLKHLPAKLLIATPDRILALMRQPTQGTTTPAMLAAGAAEPSRLRLDKLRVLVVDEADALLRRDYHNKVKAIYRAAVGGKKNKGEEPFAGTETVHPVRDSLQLLFFSAIFPQELRTTIEADFSTAETLDLVSAAHRPPPIEMTADCENADMRREGMATQKHLSGSAVVGAGVQHHICYVVPHNTLGISAGTRSARTSQTNEEAQLEKERKMLAVAEALRTYIPTVQLDVRRSSATNSEKTRSKGGETFEDTSEAYQFSAAPAPLSEVADGSNEKIAAATNAPQCIIFADSHDEVRYVSNHPLLDGWRITSAYSSMDISERQHAMQSFAEGRASVLVCTDVAARGLDVPAVVLVIHMHPPSPPVNYIHRTGRAGRGNASGTSVLLCSSIETLKCRNVERVADVQFERRELPAVADCQELVLKQLTADMLNVPKSQYEPLLNLAGRLHASVGTRALATVVLKLGGTTAYSTPGPLTTDSHSILSGRRDFVPLLLYDPTHERLEGSMAARRFLMGLLPSGANAEAVGRVAKSANGFVADVSVTYADHVIQQGIFRGERFDESLCKRNNVSSADSLDNRIWVPVFHLDRLPRLLNQGMGRRKQGRRLPWSKMRLSFLRSKQQAREGAANKKRILQNDLVQLQTLNNASVNTNRTSSGV